MKKTILTGIALTLFTGQSYAIDIPNLNFAAGLDGKELILRITPPDNNHFNLEAPNQIEIFKNKKILKPTTATEETLEYKFTSETNLKFTITSYICDDAKTYCIPKKNRMIWTGSNLAEDTSAVAILSDEKINIPSYKKDSQGFIINNPTAAKLESEKTGKPMLIDFFAIWCPPCNQLDEEVYSEEKFKRLSKDFILTKIDADSSVSWEWKTKYNITGYPTVIFAAPNGDEISRFVGFYDLASFEKTMSMAKKFTSFDELKQAADEGKEDASKSLGDFYFFRNDFNNALKFYKSPYEKRKVEIEIAKKNDDFPKELFLKTAKEFPISLLAVDSLVEIANHFPENSNESKTYWERAVDVAEQLIPKYTGRNIEFSDVSIADLYQLIAEGYTKIDHKDAAKKNYQNAINEYKKRIRKYSKSSNRSAILDMSYCLWKSGKVSEAEKQYDQMISKYPKEFTFHFAKSRMYFNLKDFKKGLYHAKEAFDNSYGDNRLRATESLAQFYKNLNMKKDGIELINKVLANAEKPKDPEIRSNRYIKSLEKLKRELEP